jgi:hypothetical protein
MYHFRMANGTGAMAAPGVSKERSVKGFYYSKESLSSLYSSFVVPKHNVLKVKKLISQTTQFVFAYHCITTFYLRTLVIYCINRNLLFTRCDKVVPGSRNYKSPSSSPSLSPSSSSPTRFRILFFSPDLTKF